MIFFRLSVLLLAVLFPSVLAQNKQNRMEKPNILLILVDDMGWQDTSVPFHFDQEGTPVPSPGNAIFKTPGMEKLAEQGMRFTQAYAASVCSPARTAILTGQNPSRTHISCWTYPTDPRDNSMKKIKDMKAPDWRKSGVNSKDPSMAKMFRAAGYRTILVGKAHFGPNSNKEAQPLSQGFDVSIAGNGSGHPGSYLSEDKYSRNKKKPGTGPNDVIDMEKYYDSGLFLTDALTEEMKREIRISAGKKQPFFAYMAHYAVHSPFMMDKQFAEQYSHLNGPLKHFASLISGMDKSIIELLKTLEENGVAENTLVVFASDNGGDAPKQNPCAPLRARKGTGYEGGIRTPLIISWAKPNPAHPLQKRYPIKAGTHSDQIIALHDLYATFASIAGGKVPKGLDSYDCSGYLRDGSSCKRPQTYFLNFPHDHTDTYYVLYREGDWKVLYHYQTRSWELYNLKDDIGEKDNLAAREPARLAEMAKKLVSEHKRHNSQLPIDLKTGKPASIILPGARDT